VEAQSGQPGLSQVERVVDTFVASSKTFTDILRSTSWWLPFRSLVEDALAILQDACAVSSVMKSGAKARR
jgi:hypothetical protein